MLLFHALVATGAEGATGSGFVPIPALYYTPETDLAAGGLFIYYWRENDVGAPADPFTDSSARSSGSVAPKTADAKPSELKPIVIFTRKDQLITSLTVNRRFAGERYSFFGRYRQYPDKYWGIGSNTLAAAEEDYSTDIASGELSWQKTLRELSGQENSGNAEIELGPIVSLQKYDVTKFQPGGAVANEDLASRHAGAGIVLTVDSRDNLFAPQSGTFAQYRLVRNFGIARASSPWTAFNADIRHYFTFPAGHVLASRAYLQAQSGRVPFRDLANLGGPDQMRGWYEGRFRDKAALSSELEYRFPLLWRFRGALTGAVGSVGGNLKELLANRFKYSAGAGIRFTVDEKERIAIRADYGATPESDGLYIQLNEAF